uniref:Uncharacterized protein n=1 Tax=Anguilla anguilla TaxID=7936 RepID=A0A0E9X8Q5_ANGAN
MADVLPISGSAPGILLPDQLSFVPTSTLR